MQRLISIADCPASDGSRFDLWQFAGTAGDTITIDMHATAFDSYLVLLDPSDVPGAAAGRRRASRRDAGAPSHFAMIVARARPVVLAT